MKINPNFEPQPGQGPARASSTGATGTSGAVHNNPRTAESLQSNAADKADLSSEAQQFAMLSAQAANVPEVRADRVASLKNAIQTGTYSVSNRQIAQAVSRDLK